jgi:two-component system chemotaxis response regulator CheB
MSRKPIRAIVVDDSALMRTLLAEILASDPEIEVVGTAEDPYDAREKIKQLNPDVITLDVEMPRMHGLDFLEKIMTLRPMPVVMVSSLTTEGAEVTLRALELGAVDFVGKPSGNREEIKQKRREIIAKVKAAARARVRPAAERPVSKATAHAGYRAGGKIVAIGASTGGVEALSQVLAAMPTTAPPILIAQHMPDRFVPSFAARLNAMCAMTVAVAQDGQPLRPGHAYIAPGNIHLQLAGKSAGLYRCQLLGTERVNGHCPSVDMLFQSTARHAGANAVGVILTGMGSDGAMGLLQMRRQGARTIGQDEATALIYGMPRVAFESGAVEEQAPLGRIAGRILELCAAVSLPH